MKQRGMKILSLLLTLVLMLGLMPGMSLTAYAADSSYEFTTSYNVLTYTNNIITVTAGYCDGDGFNLMNGEAPVQITAVDGWMITKIEMVCKYVNGPYNADEITATNGTVTTQGTISKGTTVTIDNINANSTSISRNAHGWVQFNQFKIYYGIAHTHSFTYSASGATITATCGNTGCDITTGLTLSISAPTGNLVADGTTTFPATLSTGYNTTAFPANSISAISYTKDGQPFNGTPKDAGAYVASVTVGTGNGAATASVSYTIAAPQPTTYKVTYVANNGSGDTKEYNPNIGEIHTVEGQLFAAPQGKVFDNWLGDDGNTYLQGAQINTNRTLTAQWKDKSQGGGSHGGNGSGADIVFNIPGVGDGWEYIGGYVAPQQAYRVSLAPMQGGSAVLVLNTGESGETMNVYPQTTVRVVPSPAPGYRLASIVWSMIDGSASYDITEAQNFVMPAMDVVVYVTFRPLAS